MSAIRPGNLVCPLVISALCLLLQLLPDGIQQLLQFEHRAVLQGEVWRLLSGPLIHLNTAHLLMNLLGLWLIWWLFFTQANGTYLCLTLLPILLVGTSSALLLLNPELSWYRGLSGPLHGLLVLALLRQARSGSFSAYLLLALFAGKLLWEQMQGPAAASEAWIGGRVIVDSHLYGAILGGLIWLLIPSHQHFKQREVDG